jgi:DNA polymerase III delta subunit
MIIIHGENTIASREKLMENFAEAKRENREIVRFDAKELSEVILEELFGTSDLFGGKKTIVIEGLHSLPKSTKQKTMIQMCAQADLHDLVLWEKRELTATMLKNFAKAQVFSFKASKTLFAWLDSLGKKGDETKKIQLLHDALSADGEYFCFIMLIRQFRLLIQIKSGEKIAGAPFMITKLKAQASFFSLEEMLKIYNQLLEMDYSQKTSKNLLSLNQWLDLLTLKI